MAHVSRTDCSPLEIASARNEVSEGLHRLSSSVLDYDEVDDLRNGVLPVMEELFDAHSSTFFLTQGSDYRLNLNRIINRNIPERYAAQYREHYHEQDPFFIHQPSFDTVATIDQLVSLNELEKTSFYNEFLTHQSIYHGMCIYLALSNKLLGAIFVCRPKHARAFDTMDQNKARLAAPILIMALERVILKNRIAQHQNIIDSVIPELPYKPLLAFDEYMEPVYMHEDLEDFFPALSHGNKQEQFESCFFPGDIQRVCEDLARSAAEDNNNCWESNCLLPAKTGRDNVSAHLSYLKESNIFLLKVNEESSSLPFLRALKAFGFTRREQEVIELVCKGLKNRQIAERLFISNRTVENHLRAIFEKANVNNRTSLAHFVTELAGRTPTNVRPQKS